MRSQSKYVTIVKWPVPVFTSCREDLQLLSLWSSRSVITSKLFPCAIFCAFVGLAGPTQAQSVGSAEQLLIEQGVRDVLSSPGGILTVPDATRTVNRQQSAPPAKAAEYEYGADQTAKLCNEPQSDELTFSSQGEYGPEDIGSTAGQSFEPSDC